MQLFSRQLIIPSQIGSIDAAEIVGMGETREVSLRVKTDKS